MPIASVPQVQPPAIVQALPACTAADLSLGIDREGDGFAGMSHAGALIVFRDVGPTACRLPGLPTLRFSGPDGTTLPLARRAPPGLNPGPVVLPVGLASGAEATAPLLWTSANVFGDGRCFDVARVTADLGDGETVSAPLEAHICTPAGRQAAFDQPVLKVDPLLGR